MSISKHLLISLCLIIIGTIISAQDHEKLMQTLATASFEEKFETANLLLEDHMYEYALDVLNNLVEENPDHANINYKLGYCYLMLKKDRHKSIPYLETAVQKVSRNYDPFSYREENAPVDAHYHLGQAYHLGYKFDQAIASFKTFAEQAHKRNRLVKGVDTRIQMCENALSYYNDPKKVDLKNVSDKINSKAADHSPVITVDESVLFLTSRRMRADSSNYGIHNKEDGDYYEDVYAVYKNKDGSWNQPELLSFSKSSSPRSNEATIGVSMDGQSLFVYKDIDGGDIYESKMDGLDYTTPQKMGSDINSKYRETHATISPDGTALYFVSDRPGGLGGQDIYRCTKLPNGKWSLATNVGAPINTPDDEESPFLHPDGVTLFFSSNSSQSMGGYDIFFSKKDDDNGWTTPINMGYPLNTVENDVFYVTTADGKTGYYSSERDDSRGKSDIYMVISDESVTNTIAILKGYIISGDSSKIPASTTVWVTDIDEGTNALDFSPRSRDGAYVLNLKPGHTYDLNYQAEGSTFYQTTIKVPESAAYSKLKDVYMLNTVSLLDEVVNNASDGKDLTEYWQIVTDQPAKLYAGFGQEAIYVDGNDSVLFREQVSEKGTFKYHKEASKDDHKIYLETNSSSATEKIDLQPFTKDNEKTLIPAPHVEWKKIQLSDELDVSLTKPLTYIKYFTYNAIPSRDEAEFSEFVKQVAQYCIKGKIVNINIEGSASKVPTVSRGSNAKLAGFRSKQAKKLLLKRLKKENVNLQSVKIKSITSLVQGPSYSFDATKNKNIYRKYQYVKITAN